MLRVKRAGGRNFETGGRCKFEEGDYQGDRRGAFPAAGQVGGNGK